jgi:hypothetical protein
MGGKPIQNDGLGLAGGKWLTFRGYPLGANTLLWLFSVCQKRMEGIFFP